jgi:glycosyltransferase involved in cell wall biosynthesis
MPVSEAPDNSAELPRVSLVTPAYNQAQFLAETIDSVLAQDYPNLEYIVIDDGSTDGTAELLRGYGGRIHWERQDNRGQAATLNRGWAKASGAIIGYLSSDDKLKPGAVSELVRYLLANPGIVLVYPDFDLIDAGGRLIRTFTTPEFSYRDLVVDLVCQPGPGALFWKKHFDEAGGWHPGLRQIPDFEYWLRLSQYGDFRRVPKALACSRIHAASQSFRNVSIERAMEPVQCINTLVATGALRFPAAKLSRHALASAYLLSFRMLVRSGRWRAAAACLAPALRLRPGLVGRASAWRTVGGAVCGKAFYRRFFRV